MDKKLVFLLLLCTAIQAGAQCLTDFTKLLPETSPAYSLDFGRSVAMYDKYMAVSLPNSDSLGRLTGLVYMYEEVNGSWKKVGTMAPSDPLDALQFGYNVSLSENYLLVSATGYGGMVYVFKKGAAGWESQTELTKLQVAESVNFGNNYNGNPSMVISPDEQTFVITDYERMQSGSNSYIGEIYVYHKNIAEEWSNTITPAIIRAPVIDVLNFGKTGVALYGNRIVTGSHYINKLFVFHDPSGNFSNFTIEATLSTTDINSYYLGLYNVVFNASGIFATSTENSNGQAPLKVQYYETPANGIWTDTPPTCSFESSEIPTGGSLIRKIHLSTNGTDILVASNREDGSGYFNLIKKGQNGWCDPHYQPIDYTPLQPGQITSYYGYVNASNQHSDAVVGYLPLPGHVNASLALKTFKKDGTGWNSQLLYSEKKSTAGHYYGNAILGYENHLFVSATGDGTVKSGGGAVYYYEKDATGWHKKKKILAPHPTRYDDVFGSALASNKEYLAIGAAGYEPHGRVFLYKKGATGWEGATLAQEIELPEDKLTIFAYGDNLAMNEKWLIIPYVQNSPYRIMLAFYQFDGTQWNYSQVVECNGLGSFFSKFSTTSISIDGGTVLAGNLILEQDEAGLWKIHYTLSPSDPEYAQIAPDFSHWISNGSLFGQTSTIDGNTIYIGAPAKDHLGKWDVGAVYVYTKAPGESWSSRTENAKLLPRVKEERELFGYSLKGFGNTLLVGAPGSDFNKDGAARNKPGRAYVFQSKDYYWQDVVSLIDFTGDSFVKDYFGIKVYLDQSDFFISASIEDIASGKLSGSVYVTPSPPIIKLVPPVCATEETIDLFGYPFGGVWTGPGIIDPIEGTFDPKVAGIGIHEFRYTTPSCAYEGVLRVEVTAPPVAKLNVATDFKLCAGQPVNITLSAASYPNTYYSWYHRSDNSQPFKSLGIYAPSMRASQRGDYQLKVYNKACAVYTPIISITNENIDLEVPTDLKVCKDSPQIVLSATPAGGTWSGPGVLNNKFSSNNLAAGTHKLYYQYKSGLGCVFTEETEINVVQNYTPQIERIQGNLCEEGTVTLALKNSPPDGTQINWKRQDGHNLQSLPGIGESIVVSQAGKYLAFSQSDVCQGSSIPFELNDQLKINLLPKETKLEACDGAKVRLEATEIQNANYIWYFSELKDAGYSTYPGSTNRLITNKSGYYQLEVIKGNCTFLTAPKQVFIHAKDSIFVPNVFTPNGDGKNDVFKISGNIEGATLLILNRYGKTVYEGNSNLGWNGDDLSAGVYYWFIQYSTCEDKYKTLRGYIQLIR